MHHFQEEDSGHDESNNNIPIYNYQSIQMYLLPAFEPFLHEVAKKYLYEFGTEKENADEIVSATDLVLDHRELIDDSVFKEQKTSAYYHLRDPVEFESHD